MSNLECTCVFCSFKDGSNAEKFEIQNPKSRIGKVRRNG